MLCKVRRELGEGDVLGAVTVRARVRARLRARIRIRVRVRVRVSASDVLGAVGVEALEDLLELRLVRVRVRVSVRVRGRGRVRGRFRVRDRLELRLRAVVGAQLCRQPHQPADLRGPARGVRVRVRVG